MKMYITGGQRNSPRKSSWSNGDSKMKNKYGSRKPSYRLTMADIEAVFSAIAIANNATYLDSPMITEYDDTKQLLPEKHPVTIGFLPHEITARGDTSINAFKAAINEGEAPASRLKVITIGDVGAGKTSLCRALGNQAFIEDCEELRDQEYSEQMLSKTELNHSWELVDSEDCHLDDIIATVVSESIASEMKPVREKEDDYQLVPFASSLPGLFDDDQSSSGFIADSHISVEGTPRKMPASKIAEHLAAKTSKPQDKQPGVKITLCDFSGRQIYETMQHIFMIARGLYLVVFNLVEMQEDQEKCLGRIHYWLNSIASHTSKDAPVVIVGTHRENVQEETVKIANKLCQEQFGDTFGGRIVRKCEEEIVFAVENKHGQKDGEIDLLIHRINNEASAFPSVSEKIPLKWSYCEEEIVSYQEQPSSKKIMSRNELETMLEENCEISFTKGEFGLMLSFFHENGVILVPDFMPDSETKSSLRDLVVISPQLLVDLMKKIHCIPARDDPLKRRFSDEYRKLEREAKADYRLLINHVCQDFENPDVLIDLLCHFNLLYPLPKNVDQPQQDAVSSSHSNRPVRNFVVPSMLKKRSNKSVEKRWKKICDKWTNLSPPEFELVFDFQPFLPPALFHHLLVSVTKYCQKTKGMQPYITRNACVFSFSNHFLFKMQLDLKNGRILFFIRCKQGKRFSDLASTLAEQVKSICSTHFRRLHFDDQPCSRKECPSNKLHFPNLCASSSSDESSSDNSTGEDEGPSVNSTGDDECHSNDQTLDTTRGIKCYHIVHRCTDYSDSVVGCNGSDVKENDQDANSIQGQS